MKHTLRGRPRLNLAMSDILEAVHRNGQVVAAARELGCSDAYIHVRMKAACLTLGDVLEAASVTDLLSETKDA
jgi:molybdenum-dependent DNA-binding transcriptional regulator ModE